jgi:hypothetical protein
MVVDRYPSAAAETPRRRLSTTYARPVTTTAPPTTVRNADEAVRRHGRLGTAYLEGMWLGDPLADACADDAARIGRGRYMRMLREALADGIRSVPDAPDSLRALFAELDEVPDWADLAAIDLGVRDIARYSRQTGIALGAASLLAGYANPTASRPLEMTGRYIESAGMRTIEVGTWLRAVSSVGGLERHSPGFERTVRVRMIHAFVRQHLREDPAWDLAAWGVPIPQSHLAYTIDEFCLILLRALARVGVTFRPHEVADGFYARWRYLGHLLGVGPDLLPATEADQQALEDLHLMTRPPMEEFCRALVRGINAEFLEPEVDLILGPLKRWSPTTVHGLERLFMGDDICDDLGVPASRVGPVVAALGRPLGVVNRALDRSPALVERRRRRGSTYTDEQEERLRSTYAVHHEMVDDSPASGIAHPARVAG